MNEYELSECGNFYTISFANSDKKGVFDAEDYEKVVNYVWGAKKERTTDVHYAHTNKMIDRDNNKRKTVSMHSVVLGEIKEKKYVIDHINGNGLDNRKSNLRVVTQSENNMNKKIQSNNTSGFAGVAWHSKQMMWNVTITLRGEIISIGSFYYMRNALRARIEAENEYFKEHAFYLRSEDYRKKVYEVLSLPEIKEPMIISKPRSNTGIRGVSWYEPRKIYTASFNHESVRFKKLEDAVEWRKNKEIENWGDVVILTRDEKEEKLI